MLYLGLDVGTQGTKGLLVCADEGRVVARAAAAYDLLSGLEPGAAEQHPSQWLAAVRAVVAELMAHADVDRDRLAGLGVSGQQHGFVALDAAGDVLRPAKLWCDTTTAGEARELSETYGRRVPTGFTASKILWMKRHEPELFARLRTVLLPHDYVNWWLTGEFTMEAGDASGTGFFDPRERSFVDREMRAIDHSLPDMLPPLVRAGEPAGRLCEATAAELGLAPGLPVSSGGGDNMMSAIGSGAVRPGVVVMSLGTSGTVFACSEVPAVDPSGLIAPFCDSTGKWLPLLCVMNVTGVTEEVLAAFSIDHEAATRAAEAVPLGSHGLRLLPYLQGERVPDLPEASGVLSGLRSGSLRPGPLFRAALEGTSFNLAYGVNRMRLLGLEIDVVRLVGGGARNPLWRSILADVLRVPVRAMAEPESAALGAALQALWTVRRATGDETPLTELCDRFLAFDGDEVAPDDERVEVYASAYKEFEDLLVRNYGAELNAD